MRLPTPEEKELCNKLNKAKSIEERAEIYNEYYKGKKEPQPGDWVVDGNVGGYIDQSGRFVVCEEYGTAEQFDRNAEDVMNGNGYYNSNGDYVSYKNID